MPQSIFKNPNFQKRQLAIQVIKLRIFLRNKAVYTMVSLALCLGTAKVSVAQTNSTSAQTNSTTSVTNNVTPGFLQNGTPFTIDSGVSCPTPSFNITAFGGVADGSADETIININSNANLNNFGVAFGFNIPLSGSLGRFCKEYAAKQLTIADQTIQENLAAVSASNTIAVSNLLNACIQFANLKVDFNSKAFKEDGLFSQYAVCNDVEFLTDNGEPLSGSSPALTSVSNKPPEPPAFKTLSPKPTDVRIIP